MAQIGSVSADQLMAGSSVLSRPAEEFENDATVEAMWAMKAFEHAEIYFNILCSVDPKLLKLTPHDDLIYKSFREVFPSLSIAKLSEDEMKSPEGKNKWRPFCEQFKDIIEDYSMGTLLRADCTDEYSEQNSILVSRIQFYAIELARNREGLNDLIRQKFKPKKLTKNS
ncbi:Similar to Pbdc1: Protein PBDC1 (Mus musculus) [Cotesia congregata]|uniref:Similar to Pbdc1: Protein PBDC1 (Mus musculus) n=1 Tax=Cotesia congregata TaxID=51543 RepID=A0A8J2H9K2_COTCN|nr:Similar to Pbdc1: Protein PBDC1 (Mus musculus) [Cotesia congregata]